MATTFNLSLSALDDKINDARTRLAGLESDYLNQKTVLEKRIAALQAIRSQITPEIEVLIGKVNAALAL